ncbi:hypothetical protein LTR62_006781 [Meristemomyces frigidus]|uniref:Uncharacterized protein n=1 Tax=Meristemomyces frigidus TaxID=1508187 RepID=A0AAN7YE97_9PEZI|nr:hypothetical protein LTR62_006781 [Meristemomyces frigidus]
MAKRKRPSIGARTQTPALGRQVTTIIREKKAGNIYVDPPRLPRHVRAYNRHKHDLESTPPEQKTVTLADRFHGLPGA